MANVAPAIRSLFDSTPGLEIRQRAEVYACTDHLKARVLLGDRIMARAEGNHGVYNVSLTVRGDIVDAFCECMSEKRPCKHVLALAKTYLEEPESFRLLS